MSLGEVAEGAPASVLRVDIKPCRRSSALSRSSQKNLLESVFALRLPQILSTFLQQRLERIPMVFYSDLHCLFS